MRIPLLSLLFLIPIFSISVSSQCLDDQKSLLLQLKNTLNFSLTISTKLSNWAPAFDCCLWNGVTCDHNGYVTGLDLNSEAISNGIGYSSTLFSLRYLETLNLAFNSFNSTPIPSSIGNLTNLVYLNLSNSGFSGQIPIELSFLTRLVTLDISTTTPYFPPIHTLQIQNPNLSTLFGNHSGIEELHLDGVNISANGYEWGRAISSSLPNLRVLSLSNCYLSGPIDVSLQNLQNLSEINLGLNNLSSLVPDFFVNFPNLTVLRLGYSNLFGTFPDKIFQLVQTLETLDLTNNPFLKGSLHDFPENGSLRNLVLSDTNFSGNVPETIGNLMELRRIEIPWCNFNGPIPKSLANLSQLVFLDFSSNNFTGPIPWLQRSKNVTHIDFSHNALTGVVLSTHFEGLLNLVYADLAYNSFNGSIPSSLFSLPSLQKILLSNNKFGGQITGLSKKSLSPLDTLDLSSNKLEGPIPSYFFDFRRLNILSLSFNNFNGTVELGSIQRLRNLTRLELSYNNLTVDVSANISSLSSFPQLTVLSLASCNLKMFPALMNQSRISHLDLSDNHISGVIPSWLWNGGDGKLEFLNLSCNLLVGLQSVFIKPSLSVLDLHSNQLSGEIPVPPEAAIYVDYSGNKFSSSIPAEVGNGIASAIFFSLSDNMLSGPIPPSICNGTYLQVLDLSNNRFGGKIPQCLIDNRTETLGVLNLGNNSLSGNMSGMFRQGCALKTLDLSANKLEGQVSESLSNCANLEVLNLGSNRMRGNFPCFLKNSSNLRVLVLRANSFQGGISCPEVNDSTWPKLQIIDLALNNFSGILPPKLFLQRKAMMDGGNTQPDINHLRFGVFTFNKLYYQDSVTVINKGLEMKLVKILTIFTAIDFSNNSFEGEIPGAIGALSSLYVLNLSQNALSGEIPSNLGNLTLLGSLDLSFNKLYGRIPVTLARLTFLSFLNLSYNQLFGRIPLGTQLQTFSNASFEGNVGLCGYPLNKTCKDTPPEPFPKRRVKDSGSFLKIKFDWQFITGLGFGIGAGFVVGPLVFWKQGSSWCDKQIEHVVWMIGPTVGLIFSCCGGVKVDTESTIEEEHETVDSDEEDGEDMEENAFPGRYCVFCSKLDIHRKKAVHDPNCSCHESPSFSSSSSSSSSS